MLTYRGPDGDNRAAGTDPGARNFVDQDQECVEDLFGQLWVIPKSEPRVPPPRSHGESLFWIRRDLVREKRVRLEDCYLVSRSQRVGKVSMTLSFARDIWSGGKTYKEALNSIPMAEGGRWVW
jgi:hypothetical protein